MGPSFARLGYPKESPFENWWDTLAACCDHVTRPAIQFDFSGAGRAVGGGWRIKL